MAIPLNHHVYSSLGGYKTLYASPSIPKSLAGGLEKLAVHIYRLAHKRQVFACFYPDGQTVCLVRAFQNGTDHAGRIRRCVHAVVFSLSDAAGDWFFSPLQVPYDVFLSPEASLQALRNELRYEYEVPPFEANYASLSPARELSHDCLLGLLEAMIAAGGDPDGGSSVVLDERGDALDVVRSLAWTMPPAVRKMISVSAGAVMPYVPELGRVRIALLPSSAGGREALLKNEALIADADAVIEFPSGNAIKATRPNPYADFVASNIHSEVGFERVKKLAALLERTPPSMGSATGAATERFEVLLEAFDKIEQDVGEFGTVNVRRDAMASLSAAKELAAAGMPGLSLDILMAVSSLAIDQHGFDGASYQDTVRLLKAGEVEEEDKLVEAVSYLADALRKLLTEAKDGNQRGF